MKSIKKRLFCFGIACCPNTGAARNIKDQITSASVANPARTYIKGRLTMGNKNTFPELGGDPITSNLDRIKVVDDVYNARDWETWGFLNDNGGVQRKKERLRFCTP